MTYDPVVNLPEDSQTPFPLYGPTSTRPPNPAITQRYVDTTISPDAKPIWWNGSTWIDATGTPV